MSLDTIREKKTSTWVYVIIGFLLLGMIGFGTQQFGQGGGAADAVLELGDNNVTQQELSNMMSSLASNDPNMSTEMLTESAMTLLSARLALKNYMDKFPFTASFAAIKNEIVNDPNFFVDGKFDATTYESTIRTKPEVYEQYIAEQMSLRDFQNRIINSVIVSDAEIMPLKDLQNLVRDIEFVVIPKAEFSANISDEEAKVYFEENKDNYKSLEKWNIRFIEADKSKLKDKFSATPEEINAAYNAYVENAKANEVRDVSYLLFATDKQAVAEEAAKALQAGDKTYAQISEELKDDINDQDDLNNLKRTDALIAEFADTIFSIPAAGDFSNAIKTADGVFVFKLNKSSLAVKAKEEMSAEELTALAVDEKSTAEFNRISKIIEEEGYDETKTLDNLAQSAGLAVNETGLVAFNQFEQALANNEVRQILTDDTMAKESNQVIPFETNDGRVIAMTVTEHELPQLQEFDVVKDAVIADLRAKRQAEQQIQAATDLVEQLKSSEATKMADVITDKEIHRVEKLAGSTEAPDLDILAKMTILRAPALTGLENANTANTINGDILVYVVDKAVIGEETNSEDNEAYINSISQSWGSAEMEAFLKSITERAKIVRLQQ